MVLRNDIALFAWWFMAIWWAMLLAAVWLVLRDGPPDGLSWWMTAGILAIFVAGGAAGAAWALRQRRVRAEVGADGLLRLGESLPFRRQRLVLPRDAAEAVEVEQTTDSDGDPYFRCWLVLRDGRRFAVQEGHRVQAIESDARRLRVALGLR
ncbi:hypothetical protein [Falsiroseomonas oryziterrae]|uniref:hypothetical protein n=1 Tax=Falsiroseomonas oryziterrae TaxID=2911368 RepID=UPI001F163258|nr:hypothetical protein [Roseomonas sp. NPKOSM-4]